VKISNSGILNLFDGFICVIAMKIELLVLDTILLIPYRSSFACNQTDAQYHGQHQCKMFCLSSSNLNFDWYSMFGMQIFLVVNFSSWYAESAIQILCIQLFLSSSFLQPPNCSILGAHNSNSTLDC